MAGRLIGVWKGGSGWGERRQRRSSYNEVRDEEVLRNNRWAVERHDHYER
jgi:hypothetical protein